MMNSQTGGKVWGVPFQRSTVVLYWNKELFKEAGLDPNKPPATWNEMLAYAQKLTKRDGSGNTTQWGIQVPSSGFPYWLFQGFTTQNGVELMNAAGDTTYYDKPEVIEALQFWVDLGRKHRVMPQGVVEWGTTPRDFFERKIAMMWTTTGNLTNVKNNAKFDFGVAMLPAGKRRGSPTGGGNFYVFKKSTPAAAAGRAAVHQVDHEPGARRAVGDRHRLRRRAPRRLGDADDAEVRVRLPGGGGRPRPAAVRGRRALDPREPAGDEGAERRPAGRAHRGEDARRRRCRTRSARRSGSSSRTGADVSGRHSGEGRNPVGPCVRRDPGVAPG